MSVVVTRFVERGYVRRSPVDGDRRMIQVGVTDAGREVVRNAPPTVFQQLNDALDGVPADQMAAQIERWLQSANIEISVTGDNAESPRLAIKRPMASMPSAALLCALI